MTVEVPSTWPRFCMCVCMCVWLCCVCARLGNGPFECTGAGMGSVCGRYFVHIPEMRLLRSRQCSTTGTQHVPILHQCHSSFMYFRGLFAAKWKFSHCSNITFHHHVSQNLLRCCETKLNLEHVTSHCLTLSQYLLFVCTTFGLLAIRGQYDGFF